MNNNMAVFILTVIAALGIGMYWWFSYYKPFEETKKSKQEQIKALQVELEQNKDIDKDIAAEREKKKELMEKITRLRGWFRNNGKISVILEKFEKYANTHSLKLKDIRFNPLRERQGYSELRMELSMEGLYHDFGRFLADIENQKIVNMNDAVINMAPRGQPKLNKFYKNKKEIPYNQVELTINITVKAYFIHEDKGGNLGG